MLRLWPWVALFFRHPQELVCPVTRWLEATLVSAPQSQWQSQITCCDFVRPTSWMTRRLPNLRFNRSSFELGAEPYVSQSFWPVSRLWHPHDFVLPPLKSDVTTTVSCPQSQRHNQRTRWLGALGARLRTVRRPYRWPVISMKLGNAASYQGSRCQVATGPCKVRSLRLV